MGIGRALGRLRNRHGSVQRGRVETREKVAGRSPGVFPEVAGRSPGDFPEDTHFESEVEGEQTTFSIGITFFVLLQRTNLAIVEHQQQQEEPEYDVEKIINEKMINGKLHYLVKWVGFPRYFTCLSLVGLR